jgi:hypothetical protein
MSRFGGTPARVLTTAALAIVPVGAPVVPRVMPIGNVEANDPVFLSPSCQRHRR